MNRRTILGVGVGFGMRLAGLKALAGSVWERVPLEEASDTPGDALAGPVLNQVGYLPHGEKVATVPAPAEADASFQLVEEGNPGVGGKAVFHGTLSAVVVDEASGDRVALADFSALTKPGLYRLAAGGQTSAPFAIGKDVYREALRVAMRSYYGQRCGCAVDLGGGYAHPKCHGAGAFHPTSGREGDAGNHGGWHDAGDYGRYVVNSGITTGTLLWAWELYPEAVRGISLGIPESGGKTPDWLAEIRWNLEWLLAMQDANGGVWHKQTSERFCGFVMPQADTLTSYVIGTGSEPYMSTGATADLAAVMAIAARCYGPYDAAFASRCLEASKRAWNWAVAHPNVVFNNPPGIGTGGYGDRRLDDEILWASAELWRTTADAQYEKAFLAGVEATPPESGIEAPGWGDVGPMAYWTYAMADRKKKDALRERIVTRTAETADALRARKALSGYGNTLGMGEYSWGSNAVAGNQSLLLLMAHHFAADAKKMDAALGNLHYLLGRNCFGVSWVTQLGTNAFQHPHHRPSASDGIAAPWPGLLSGGPNARPGDATARTLKKQPPMRMWMDDERAYSMNEVAINWNAPLVFVLAAANALGS